MAPRSKFSRHVSLGSALLAAAPRCAMASMHAACRRSQQAVLVRVPTDCARGVDHRDPVLAGTRSAVRSRMRSGFNTVPAAERPLLRALSRHAPRSSPATAELRGEDAAEVLSMLRGRRVLLEPASKELRFAEGELVPKVELDLANNKAVRIRVVFEQGSRRFPLSNGAWFEGTPGWHIDTSGRVAREVVDNVTPAWLQRLYRSPALVHPLQDLTRLLTEYVRGRRVTRQPSTGPEPRGGRDRRPAALQIRAVGDLVEAKVKLRVDYQGCEYDVPTTGFPSPLAFLSPERGNARARVVRRDIGAEMASVQEVLNLGGFTPDETGEYLIARGDDANPFLDGGHWHAAGELGPLHPERPRGRDDPRLGDRAAGARLERHRLAEPRSDVPGRWHRGRRGRAAAVLGLGAQTGPTCRRYVCAGQVRRSS